MGAAPEATSGVNNTTGEPGRARPQKRLTRAKRG
jgi:hypothetical protein